MAEPVRRYADFEKRLAATSLPGRRAASPLRRRVGHAIRDRRKALGITQLELGELLGAAQPSVSAWELGNALPSSEVLFKIAQVLGLDLGQLADPPRAQPVRDPGRPDHDRSE